MTANDDQQSSPELIIGAAELRDLARAKLVDTRDTTHGDHMLNPGFSDWVVKNAVTPAAVLIPLVERSDDLQFVFTKRTAHLKSHSGQIAFPGGKIDAQDQDAVSAALREAHEEIDLDPHHVEIIGNLPDYFTGSGYRISPVLALVDGNTQLHPNPDEVEYIFEVPMSFLMNVDNHHMGSRKFKGSDRYFYEMPYQEHYIWGVTAGIVRMMHEKLFK
ncbi:MAG: CoA pyrophosphatase [Pseudomonadota bacterium]